MIRAIPLTTRYDVRGRHSSLTVATPSCCCCCCCCLATTAAVLTFSGREVSNQVHTHGGRSIASLVAVLSFPIGVGAMILAANVWTSPRFWPVVAIGVVVAVAFYTLAHFLARTPDLVRGVVTSTVLAVIAGAATLAEAIAVLVTIGLIWLLLIPLGIWGAVKAADGIARRPKPSAPTDEVWRAGPIAPAPSVPTGPPPAQPPTGTPGFLMPPPAIPDIPSAPPAPPSASPNDTLPPNDPRFR